VAESSSTSANQPAGDVRARLRFAKSSRLLKHSDFERVYRQGRRYSLPDFVVFYLSRSDVALQAAHAGQERTAIRVGFTVPRALGGAVQRNRIKRRMREAVRLLLPGVSLHGPVDVVMNPRGSVAEISFEKLLRQVQEALRAIERGKGKVRNIGSAEKRESASRK
jgi:ribonuclease P protein component